MFAWFTMSREVEVKNIQMTATVPEDLQISLGKLALAADPSTAETSETGVALVKSTGTLYAATAGAADNLGAVAPENSWDWSNSADISAYYNFGKLMPASSNNGETVFFTPDATGVGRTVSGVAKYFAANSALAPETDTGSTKYNATLHAATKKNNATIDDGWADGTGTKKYTVASEWDKTNDDGYYVDIPIWIRSSGSKDINIKVDGYVLPGTGALDTTDGTAETKLELYRSVRVAILNGDTAGIDTDLTDTTAAAAVTQGAKVQTNNILPLIDAWDKARSLGYNSTTPTASLYKSIVTKDNPYAVTGASILDSGIYIERKDDVSSGLWGVSELSAYSPEEITADESGHIATGDKKPTYSEYTAYANTSPVATILKPTAAQGEYGTAKKLIIRVWLDGEDTECWNDNAGQDWKISLKFSKIES